VFGQEVRPHFLGHMGLIGISSPHWPWYWGPGYPIYGRDDRPNGSALEHSRREGGINAFVHPVSTGTPFPSEGPGGASARSGSRGHGRSRRHSRSRLSLER
jgi:TolB protein